MTKTYKKRIYIPLDKDSTRKTLLTCCSCGVQVRGDRQHMNKHESGKHKGNTPKYTLRAKNVETGKEEDALPYLTYLTQGEDNSGE